MAELQPSTRRDKSVVDIREVEVIAPNFKRRLSGVTSTIVQLVPVQRALGHRVAALGPGLPADMPHIGYADLPRLWKPPRTKRFRVWHARRNIELLAALVLRGLLGMPLKIVFTSASQRIHTRWTKWLISKADAVIATSRKTASYLSVPNTVILHGIDANRFCPTVDRQAARRALGLDPEKKLVGCFGRIRHQKGTDLFVDAMIELLANRPDWNAVVAGRATGPHVEFEKSLIEKVAKAGLADRILFVGEHTNISEWYRALDLFVAPQRWEGFGLTPLEAMATAVPVVATDVGAFPELIVTSSEETGAIIPADDLQAMIAATADFMDNEERRASASDRAFRHVRSSFSITNEISALGRVYETLLDPH